jgi:hypothetical protein
MYTLYILYLFSNLVYLKLMKYLSPLIQNKMAHQKILISHTET